MGGVLAGKINFGYLIFLAATAALGGLLFAFHSELPYAVAIGLLIVSLGCTVGLRSAAARRCGPPSPD